MAPVNANADLLCALWLISARAEWLGRAFVAHDFKTTVHIGQGRSGGIGDGSHISDADIMASMGHNFIHGAFECSGATYNRPAEREAKALTVAPVGPSSPWVVTTVTDCATWRIASINKLRSTMVFPVLS